MIKFEYKKKKSKFVSENGLEGGQDCRQEAKVRGLIQ